MIHIGQRIKEVFDRQPKDHDIMWFADRLNCKRANVYNIFNRATVDTDMLMRISKILNHDFFVELSRVYKGSSEDDQTIKAELYHDIMQSISRTVRQQLRRTTVAGNPARSCLNRKDNIDSAFPYPKYYVEVKDNELPDSIPHLHISSKGGKFEIRVAIDDGTYISTIKRGSREKGCRFEDVSAMAQEWLSKPSTSDAERTNRDVAIYFYKMLNG